MAVDGPSFGTRASEIGIRRTQRHRHVADDLMAGWAPQAAVLLFRHASPAAVVA